MTLKDDEKRLLKIVSNYPHALKLLAMRLRALEMTLQDLEPNLFGRYKTHLRDLESRKNPASDAQEWSEFDQLIDLLKELTEEKPKKKT